MVNGNFSVFAVEFSFFASLRHRLLKSEVSSVAAIWLALHFTTRVLHAVAGHPEYETARCGRSKATPDLGTTEPRLRSKDCARARQPVGVGHIDGRGGARNAVALGYAFARSSRILQSETGTDGKGEKAAHF